MQATSPLREAADLDGGIRRLREGGYDSLLSVTEVEDFFTWRTGEDGGAESVNYDYRNRKRRQMIEKRYLENGSFYVFRPETLRHDNNRLGGRIGLFTIGPYNMFQIDHPADAIGKHTSELQSLMRNSYAVFCLQNKKKHLQTQWLYTHTH